MFFLLLNMHFPCRSVLFSGVSANICLHSIHKETQFIAESFVAVGHPDMCNVCPPNIVASWSVLQVVGTNKVFLLLQINRQKMCLFVPVFFFL